MTKGADVSSSRGDGLGSRILRGIRENWRRAGLALILIGGLTILIGVGHAHYPVQHWLFWRYAVYWASALVWSATCFAMGHGVLRATRRGPLPVLEHLITAFALGVFAFELLVFGAGIVGLFGPAFFFLAPLLPLAALGVPALRYLRRVWSRCRRQMAHSPHPVMRGVLNGLGLIGLLMVYFVVLTPDNTQFDARWKHLAIAEHYVADGGIARFPEGWIFSTSPHATSFLYAWAFQLPGSLLFDRVELCAHLEFIVFLFTTVVGIPAVVRRLVPRASPALVWPARFLFPGVFVYDSSLSTGADHFAALFAPVIFLAALRAWPRLEPARCFVLAAAIAATAMVKFTAVIVLAAAPIVGLAGRTVVLTFGALRRRRREAASFWKGPAVATVTGLVLTAPYWLKNLIWHRNPVYPMGFRTFGGDPLTSDAAYMYEWAYSDYQLSGRSEGWEHIAEALRTLLTFSFEPNNYGAFHRDVPVFGSLFTLTLFCLPLLRRTRRLWALALWVHLGIFLWFLVHPLDRYLQAVVPLMAAFTAGVLILVFRTSGRIGRALAVALVGMQLVWGGDAYFFQTHAMAKSPLKRVIDLLEGGFRKKYEERFRFQETYQRIGDVVRPGGGKLLRHESHDHLGMNVPTVEDWRTWQYGLSYGEFASPRELYSALRSMGVTHVHWRSGSSRSWDSLAGDLMFFDFVLNRCEEVASFGSHTVAALPKSPPEGEETFNRNVAVLTCRSRPKAGMYRLEDLRAPTFGPRAGKYPEPRVALPKAGRNSADVQRLLEQAAFIVEETSCDLLPSSARKQFQLAAKRRRVPKLRNPQFALWVRRAN